MDEPAHDQQLTGTVGAELRAARDAQEMSLADIAARTRIPLRHLAAIEDADYARLPAATYSAGFVRTYARLLGLDAPDLSQRFRAELAAHEPVDVRRQEYYEAADPARVPSRGLAWGGVLVALLLIVGFLYWRGTQVETPAEVATAADRAAPAQPAAPAAQPAPAASPQPADQAPAPVDPAATPAIAVPVAPASVNPGDTAVLTAEQPVWLRVTDGSTKLFEGMLKAGDHFQVPAGAVDPRLRTGRATVIRTTVGSVTLPPLGPAETLIKDVSLKPDALLARAKSGAAPATPAQSR